MKRRATDSPSCQPKQILDMSVPNSKHSIQDLPVSPVATFHSKRSFDLCANTEPRTEVLWPLDYSLPCVVKGGTIPEDVVNKIINSVSKTRIQRDLSRQILFRRMRGKPNPRPGPRISSSYMVCLACASCIKSPCDHLTGRKDPHGATLFAIPTPETNSQGEIDVKLVLILSLPQTSSSNCPLEVKQLNPVFEDNLKIMEKISQISPTSKPDIIQGPDMKKSWLSVDPENEVISQQPQTVDWLLYVKKSNSSQLKSQNPSSSSSSSSTFLSSSSSSASLPSPPSTVKDATTSTLSDCTFTKVLSYHRLPPGVSWLEFIKGKSHNPLNRNLHQSQPPYPKITPIRRSNAAKITKASNPLFKFFQTKFQNERNTD
ncbi:casein kinase II subunit alpha'-interacting protein [Rhynchocyon petersi]